MSPIVLPPSFTPGQPLDARYLQKPFPAPGVTIPALSPYQVWFQGLTMGPGTALEFQKIEGMDMPAVRSGDASRAREHGLFIGLDALGGREVTITAELGPVVGETFEESWGNLASATTPGGSIESPLYLNLPGFGTLVSMARCRKRQMPIDIQFALGNLAGVTLQWNSSDPRLYAAPTDSAITSPPGTISGLTFPLGFPFSFGGGSVAGTIQLTNAGNLDCPLLLTINGPCTNPSVFLVNGLTGVTYSLGFALSMNAGDQLVIDTDMHTATYYTAGTTLGSTRLMDMIAGSQWFTLPAEAVSTLQFLTGDSIAAGSVTAESCSAYVL